MKKKGLLFLGLFLLTSFLFCTDVNAAKELTCLYEKYVPGVKKVMLIQQADGKLLVYKHKKDVGIDADGWIAAKAIPRWDYNEEKIETGSLNSCPGSVRTIIGGDNAGALRFNLSERMYDLSTWCNLEDDDDKAIIPDASHYEITDESSPYGSSSCGEIGDENRWITPYDENSNYIASCLYYEDLNDGCHIIQMNIDNNFDIFFEQYDPNPEPDIYGSGNERYTINSDTASLNITELKGNGGECPGLIYVKRKGKLEGNKANEKFVSMTTTVSLEKSDIYYSLKQNDGKNIVTGNQLIDFNLDSIGFSDVSILECSDLIGDSPELVNLIKYVYTLIKFAIPIILVGLSVIDFVKAIFSGSEDDMKKVTKKFIQRIIISVGIFLIEVILRFVLGIAYDIWGILDPTLCGILD